MKLIKDWGRFFLLSFFSHGTAKEGARRGYTNAFLSFVLALVLLWAGFVGAELLPFGVQYDTSPDFVRTVHAVLANPDVEWRIEARIKDGALQVKRYGEEYTEDLLVNTFERASDKEIYGASGYHVVVDSRPAHTLAEVEAYCVSNDGKNTVISYDDYLTLSDVARLNFDFKLRYTGNALQLSDASVAEYFQYVSGLGDENQASAEKLALELASGDITKDEYDRKIYELYFKNYYPDITSYESTSAVPLLRNYYYHQYVSKDSKNYLFIFDDYITGSFEARGGVDVSFHGFYSDLSDGDLIAKTATQDEAEELADNFVKNCFHSTASLNSYVHALNVFSLVPFLALMLMVAALLTYSILKLRGVESIHSLGATFKIVGSFAWVSGVLCALLTVGASFFVSRGLMGALPPVLFFVALLIRSVIFAIREGDSSSRPSERPIAEQTEV